MKPEIIIRFFSIILITVMMTSAVSGTVIYADSMVSDGIFYTGTHSSSSMSGTTATETSLGAVTLPGHSITQDYRLDVLVRNQQYNFKSIIIVLILSVMLASLFRELFEKEVKGIRKTYRLLI